MAHRADFARVKRDASFEKVLGHCGIRLIGTGAQRQALCPFHKDRNPSCSINLEQNVFYCFSCGVGGSILDFVAKMEHCSLSEAAATIAEWCGLAGTMHEIAPGNVRDETRRQRILCEADERRNRPLPFRLNLDPSHPYLAKRGLIPQTIELFGLGFCDRGLMKGRVCIPIHDETGVLVAYAGRWAGNDLPAGVPRYKLPGGFRKSAVLFNLHRVGGAEALVLVEGYWSVFRLWQLGVPSVALMGRTLSEMQEKLLIRSQVRLLTLLLDGDEPGRSAAGALLSRLARHQFVCRVELPDGKQPDTVDEDTLRVLLRMPGLSRHEPQSSNFRTGEKGVPGEELSRDRHTNPPAKVATGTGSPRLGERGEVGNAEQ